MRAIPTPVTTPLVLLLACGSGAPDLGGVAELSLVDEHSPGEGHLLEPLSGMPLVEVPAGRGPRGCTDGQRGCGSDESPVTEVQITRPYYLGVTEVTQEEFLAVMGYNRSTHTGCPDCPVEGLSWHQAAAFANALSAHSGIEACYRCEGHDQVVTCEDIGADVVSCAGYRLPTEAEWEHAARCGDDLRYAGGDDADGVAWHSGNADHGTEPVAGLRPNACGLHDMSGNVWEWAHDRYQSGAYRDAAAADPTGPRDGDRRVLRGGGWSASAASARVSNRFSLTASDRAPHTGMRVARTRL
jgi:formylglycine-generating enzyme required for sulfatase activity